MRVIDDVGVNWRELLAMVAATPSNLNATAWSACPVCPAAGLACHSEVWEP